MQLDMFREIIVDNFAGGGGASTGIEMATGLSVDIAINHDPAAIAMHKMNHPDTEHYCESVWDVDPVEAVRGRKVGLAWFSPDCTHHSKAKGGQPVKKEIRGLAWIAVKWALAVKPRVIMLENVEEFKDWGPIKGGKPLHTITTKDRFALTAIKTNGYQITDIGLRMLQPHELFAGQGFPSEYMHPGTKSEQIKRVGNSVPPPFADALVRANLPEMSVENSRYKIPVAN